MATDVRRTTPLIGLRFLAAVAVIFAHSPQLAVSPTLPEWGRKLLHLGHFSVPFFFCMSGFVLTLAYTNRLTLTDQRAFGQFWLARIARIWPLHLLVLAVAIAFPFVQNPLAWWQHLLEAFLVHYWVPDGPIRTGANGVTWTLSVDLFFYLTLPAWLALARLGDHRSPRFWLGVAAVIAGVQVGMIWASERLCPPIVTAWLCLNPIIRLGEFGVGIALAKAWVGLHERGWCGRPARRWSRHTATLGEVGTILVLVVCVLFHGKASFFLNLCGYYTPIAGFVLLVFALQRGRLSEMIGHRVMTFLGETSFALYLVHGLVIFHLSQAFGSRLEVWSLTALTLGVAVCLSFLLYVGFETPIRDWLLRRFKRPQPTPAELPLRQAA